MLTNKDISLIVRGRLTKPPGMQAGIFGACPKPGLIGRVEHPA